MSKTEKKETKTIIPKNALENKCEIIGRFWTVETPLKPASKNLLLKLLPYYTDLMMEHLIVHRGLKTLEISKNYVLNNLLTMGINGISLRCLEWLVTNYSKKHQIVLYNEEKKRRVHIHTEYMDQLDHYKRILFDPFCRKERIYFTWPLVNKDTQQNEDVLLVTTVGQLNFMQWAYITGVLDYAQAHEEAIQKDMEQTLAVVNKEKKACKKNGLKRKRKELSQAPGVNCTIYSVDTVLLFNQQLEEEEDAACYTAPSNAKQIELKMYNDVVFKKKKKRMGRTPKKNKEESASDVKLI